MARATTTRDSPMTIATLQPLPRALRCALFGLAAAGSAAAAEHDFAIPSAPLAEQLRAYAKQSGLQVDVDESRLSPAPRAALGGRHDDAAALQ
ncbi:MAG TPA: hypothetical protein VLF18_06800, partial [Tahibacter sp.]|nr:hypothetical protein [Tahibacter sp.]